MGMDEFKFRVMEIENKVFGAYGKVLSDAEMKRYEELCRLEQYYSDAIPPHLYDEN